MPSLVHGSSPASLSAASTVRLPSPILGVMSAAGALALLRIGSSVSWLQGALLGADAKVHADFLGGQGLIERIVKPVSGFAHTAVTPGIADFLTTVVIPHASLFAWLIMLSELCVGISLATGTFARLGGLVAILRAITNVAVGGLSPETVGHNWMLALAGLVVLLSAAGRSSGVDALLQRRFPGSRILRFLG